MDREQGHEENTHIRVQERIEEEQNIEDMKPIQSQEPPQPTQADYDEHDIELRLSYKKVPQLLDHAILTTDNQNSVIATNSNLEQTEKPQMQTQIQQNFTMTNGEDIKMVEEPEKLTQPIQPMTQDKQTNEELRNNTLPNIEKEQKNQEPEKSALPMKEDKQSGNNTLPNVQNEQKTEEPQSSTLPIKEDKQMTQKAEDINQVANDGKQMIKEEKQPSQTSTPQPRQQNEYLRSIQQIERILKDKLLSNQPFIISILKNFSPFLSYPLSNSQDYEQVDVDNELSIDSSIFDMNLLQKYDNNQQIQSLIKSNCIFHARVVYIMYCLTNSERDIYKQLKLKFSQDLRQVKSEMLQLKLRTSFSSQLWTHKRQFDYPYLSRSKLEAKPIQTEKLHYGPLVDSELFAKIQKFLIKFGFNDQNHQFNKKMTHLNKESYKVKYIEQFAFYSFKNAQQIDTFIKSDPKCDRFNNIKFYYNRQTASYSRLHVDDIHQDKATDYDWLERTHDYIQWLFPNHFQSNFNGDSYALGYVEAEIFKTDQAILQKLVKSFMIYLNFMGCRIKKIANLLMIELIDNSNQTIERLKDCIIFNTHNHLRITRILTCLSVVGLRKYAQAFLSFLNSLSMFQFIDYKRIEHPIQTMWNLYLSKTPAQKAIALQRCFLPYDDFTQVENCQNLLDSIKIANEKMGTKEGKFIAMAIIAMAIEKNGEMKSDSKWGLTVKKLSLGLRNTLSRILQRIMHD